MRLDLLSESTLLRASVLIALARQLLVAQDRPGQRLVIVVDHVVRLRRKLTHDAQHLPLGHVPERPRHLRLWRTSSLDLRLGPKRLNLTAVLVHADLCLALILTGYRIFLELDGLLDVWLTLHLRSLAWYQGPLLLLNLLNIKFILYFDHQIRILASLQLKVRRKSQITRSSQNRLSHLVGLF